MKRGLLAVVVIAVCVGAFFYLRPPKLQPDAPVAPENSATTPALQPSGATPQNSVTPSATLTNLMASGVVPSVTGARGTSAVETLQPGAVHPLEFTDLPPAVVLDALRSTFQNYASMFKGNPVGTNPEITAALNGKNPTHANFIKAEAGMRINDQGEMIDPWGTPYFFHQLSGTDMEIHSAGPDKIMWTRDDLVSH